MGWSDLLRTQWTLLLTGCLVVAVSAPAHAQGDDASLELTTVTVEGNPLYEMPPSEQTGGYAVDAATVGTSIPAALRDIPQSVSVVTREAMDDRDQDTLDELALDTPGLRVLSNDRGRSSLFARGYEYDEFNIGGLPAPMASEYGTLPDLAAFDRVEFLRGPSGLFNSTSELGGVVNLVRKRPTRDMQGHLTGRYGRFDQYHVEGDVSGPITEDGRLRGRAVASQTESDGFVDHNDTGSQAFYGTFDFDIDPDTTASIAYLHQTRDITVSNGLPTRPDGSLLDIDRSTFFGADWNDFASDSDDIIGELSHHFDNGGHGRVGVRYSDRDIDYNYAFGAGALGADGSAPAIATGSSVDQSSFSADASYSQPFEFMGNVGQIVGGADYKHYSTKGARGVLPLGSFQADRFEDIPYVDVLENGNVSRTDRTLEEIGLYTKLTVRPIERLALIGGARVSDYKVELTDRDSGATDSRDGNGKLVPYGGLVFDLDRHHSIYASYSETFKPQTAQRSEGELIEPREGQQYEIGVKGSYFAGDLNARVAAYELRDSNYATGDPGTNYSAAVGERRNKGVEVEIDGSPTRQLDLVAGYTYLDTEVERGDPSARFLLLPDHTFKFWAKYGFDHGAMDGVTLGAGIRALSDFSSSQGVEAPGYAVVDALVGYRISEHLSAKLNVNNVLDKKYYNRVGSTGTFNFYGQPRSTVASLRYDF